MALKSALLRNCFTRTWKLGLQDANSQSRGPALDNLSCAGFREGFRFGRWLVGRTSARNAGASREIALQCNSVAALRVRRILKILQLYKEIYSEHTVNNFVQSYSARFRGILNDRMMSGVRSSAGTLLGACLFHWKEESISEADLQICVDDVKQLENIKRALEGGEGNGGGGGGGGGKREDDAKEGFEVHSIQANGNGNHGSSDNSNCSSQNGNYSADQLSVNNGGARTVAAEEESFLEGWEQVMDRPQMKVWRRPIFDGELVQYKVYGTWDDVPAAAFYLTQVDLDYRKSWDNLVVKLDVIDRDAESGAEVIHWVTHFPFPMSQRDYVYVRRFMVDHESNIAILMSKGVEHPKEPVRKKYVRVHRYMSNMVIKPHSTFEDEGLDYVLTYYDDPQANIPSVAMSWMATTGLPKFTEELRLATLDMVKVKGMPMVKQMFQRRIEEQPLGTLKKREQPLEQRTMEDDVEMDEEEEEAERWRAIFDINNNHPIAGSIQIAADGVADVAADAPVVVADDGDAAAADETAVDVAGVTAVNAADVTVIDAAVIDATTKGEEAETTDAREAVEEEVALLVPFPASTGMERNASSLDLETVDESSRCEDDDDDHVSDALPSRPYDVVDDDDDVESDAAPRPARRWNCNENNNAAAADDDDDVSAIVGNQATAITAALEHFVDAAIDAPQLQPQPQLQPPLQPQPFDEEPLAATADTRAYVLRCVTRDLDSLLLLNKNRQNSPTTTTLRDVVWELSSSTSSFHALQGRDYPGMHAYNPSYLVSRNSWLWRGVDAFCLVE